MAIVERHTSPDGLLVLLVDSTAGDWTIGFDGYPSHTHGDILIEYEGLPEARTRAYVDDIVLSRREIVVLRTDGKVSNIFVPDNLVDRPLSKTFAKHAPPNETVEVRYWNGQQVS